MPATFALRNLTIDEALAEIRNFCDVYELVPKCDLARLQFDLTVERFRDLCDHEADWPDFFSYFGLCRAESRWQTWNPPECLRDLCVDIVARLRVPVSDPMTLLGNTCETAGMFAMMKQLLIQSGADTSAMSPSTPIKHFASRDPHLFCRIRLARPGRLPEPWFHPRADGWLVGVGVGIAIASAAYCAAPIFSAAIVLGLIFGGCAVLFANGFLNPYDRHTVAFQGIVTFRDFIHASFDRPASTSR